MSGRAARSGVAGRAFRALWFGQTVSALGTQVSLVALPLVAVLVLHVSPIELGVLAALETLPYLVLALPAGVFIDRADRRVTMIVCDLGRAVVLLGTGLAIATGIVSIGLLCAVALVVGSLSVFFSVAYSTYVPSILAADQLVAGNQRLELSDSAAQVVGPSVGGMVLHLAGGAVTAALDAVSYLVSAIAILAARPPRDSELAPRAERIAMFAGIGEGLRRVAGDRVLRDLAGSTGLFNLGSGMLLAGVVLFATTEVGLDAAGFGLVYGAGNVGFILGALAVGALTKRVGVGRAFAWSTYLGAVAMILIAIAGGAAGAFLLLAGRFVGAVAAPLFNVNALSLRQARVSDEIMGRVNATFLFIDWGPLPIGSLLGGLLAGAFGPRAALIAAACCGVAGAVWVRLSPAARLSSLSPPAAGSAVDGSPADEGDEIPHDPRLVA
ncbi:MAG: MFS transporter [Chloroflexota bacterium]|nr:MFS transporter [Chloroflexota bacterium]